MLTKKLKLNIAREFINYRLTNNPTTEEPYYQIFDNNQIEITFETEPLFDYLVSFCITDDHFETTKTGASAITKTKLSNLGNQYFELITQLISDGEI